MRFGTALVVRVARSVAIATAVACAAFGTVASSALAWGGGDRNTYTVQVSPATAQAGSSTTFDVALKNTSSPGTSIGSAAMTPPLGFRVTHVSFPAGAKGQAYVLFNIVVLDRLNVAPGSTLHVTVTAKAPSRCHDYFDRWWTVANGGGFFGEPFRLDASNSSLTTRVTCASPASALAFDTQPSNTSVGDTISGSPDDPTGAPVTVKIVDASGNVVDSSAPVTVAIGANPGNGTLAGTTTKNAVNGVATFDDLSLNQPGVSYTLTASTSGLTGATSNQFNEDQTTTTTCSTNPCTTDLSTSVSEPRSARHKAPGR